MPHRLSLVRRLALLRRAYTGETDSSLLPVVTSGVQRLTADDRALLHEILDHNHMARLFGHDEMPPPPPHVRQALLHDTTDPAQQELESAVLSAAGKAVNYLYLRQPADLGRPARIFRMVRPGRDEMVLHLYGGVLGPLLAELMPREIGGAVTGVPGLRAEVCRRHVDLYLVDQPQARIMLSNVSWRHWTAALTFVDRVIGSLGELAWLGNDPTPLTEAEQFTMATRHRAPGPVALNSALLRRGGVFRDVRWWRAWTRGRTTTTIEWPTESAVSVLPASDTAEPRPVAASLHLGTVARLLLHPLFGIPGHSPRPHYFHNDRLTLTIPDHDNGDARSGVVELVLRPHNPDQDDGDPFAGLSWRDASDAWTDFQRVLAAPNPTFPRPATAPKPGPHQNRT
ncbi:hypothetical protein [Kutzneria sp. NPDC051319]|uniref:hypothetical protein n=1 Tax=Kutzneria sp. NPDC051319 TaxID=3155047 RepID=UPI0034320FAE